jgi:hypothetical protein
MLSIFTILHLLTYYLYDNTFFQWPQYCPGKDPHQNESVIKWPSGSVIQDNGSEFERNICGSTTLVFDLVRLQYLYLSFEFKKHHKKP